MAAYAEGTTVTPERSQQEISGLIRRYGADQFMTGWEHGRAVVSFVARGRTVRFVLDLPTEWRNYATTPAGRTRKQAEAEAAMEGEVRRRWRALCLAIKAKFEVIETGIASFEDEFLAYTLLPNNHTVGDEIRPMVDQAIAAGQMPRQLLAIEAGDR